MARDKGSRIEKMKKQQDDLESLTEALKANAAHSLTLANKIYKETAVDKNPLKAGSSAVKAGAPVHSQNAVKSIQAIASLIDRAYQFEVVLEHYEKLEEIEDNPTFSGD